MKSPFVETSHKRVIGNQRHFFDYSQAPNSSN